MKLSVAMCSYNGAKYIREQLESILNQELPVNEIVVCDDGSKDDTINIVNDIAASNPQIRWNIQRNSPNLGVIKNYEKAITLCAGDLIFLSDQDDEWRRDKTKVIVEFFQNNPKINVVFTDAELIDGDGKSVSEHSLLDAIGLLPYIKYWNNGLQFEILMAANRATGATMAFRKTYERLFVPFIDDSDFMHDKQISLPASLDYSLGVISDKLIKYRQHGKNAIGVGNNNWIYTGKKCPNLLLQIIKLSEVKYFHWKFIDNRMLFYNERKLSSISITKRFKLIKSLPLYKKYYNRYWGIFFLYDMTRVKSLFQHFIKNIRIF